MQPAVRANYERAIEALRPFAAFSEIDLPPAPYGTVTSTIISCEMATAFEGLVTSGDVRREPPHLPCPEVSRTDGRVLSASVHESFGAP
ncbi:MAG: hypothetical protein ACRD4Q_09545 [Candidatus Acidiferrales bacterium]